MPSKPEVRRARTLRRFHENKGSPSFDARTIIYASRNQAKRRGHASISMSFDELEAFLKESPRVCRVCRVTEGELSTRHVSARKLQVDHDHRDGRVRGLVCGRCNMG